MLTHILVASKICPFFARFTGDDIPSSLEKCTHKHLHTLLPHQKYRSQFISSVSAPAHPPAYLLRALRRWRQRYAAHGLDEATPLQQRQLELPRELDEVGLLEFAQLAKTRDAGHIEGTVVAHRREIEVGEELEEGATMVLAGVVGGGVGDTGSGDIGGGSFSAAAPGASGGGGSGAASAGASPGGGFDLARSRR